MCMLADATQNAYTEPRNEEHSDCAADNTAAELAAGRTAIKCN